MKRVLAVLAATTVLLAPLSSAAASQHTDHVRHLAHLAHVRHELALSHHHAAPGGGSGGPVVDHGPTPSPTDIVLCWNTTPMTRAACAAWWADWNAKNG